MSNLYLTCTLDRDVARIFQRGGGGGGGGVTLCHTQRTCVLTLLQMFGPENGVCNYLALEKTLCNVDSSDSRFLATPEL